MHLQEIVWFKLRLKLFSEDRAVVGGDAEWNHCTNVAEDGVAHRVLHLADILIRNSKIETVFARFGQNRCKAISGEILELVDIQVERAAIFNIGNVAAAHSSELNFCDDEWT